MLSSSRDSRPQLGLKPKFVDLPLVQNQKLLPQTISSHTPERSLPHTSIDLYIYIHILVHAGIHVDLYLCIIVYLYVCICMCMHIHIHMSTHMCARVCVCQVQITQQQHEISMNDWRFPFVGEFFPFCSGPQNLEHRLMKPHMRKCAPCSNRRKISGGRGSYASSEAIYAFGLYILILEGI